MLHQIRWPEAHGRNQSDRSLRPSRAREGPARRCQRLRYRNGRLLFFRIDDFDLAQGTLSRQWLEEEPHLYPNTRTKEFSLRDPDGYYVTISALFTGYEDIAALPKLQG
jgi:hypothetical protein